MKKLMSPSLTATVALYMFVDILCIGSGMGVPFFCILLGFPLGWYITKRVSASGETSCMLHRQILKWSLLASGFTFLGMIFIWGVWGKAISILLNPTFDFKNYGHPFILYDPKASFIGWLILMVFISPFLQLLTTIFTSFVFLAMKREK
jgi:hypothetical protein